MIAEGKKIEECFSWLKERGYAPLTDRFFYKEEDGKLLTVAGVVICIGINSVYAQIEPMATEDTKASLEVYNEIIEYLKEHKVQYITAYSSYKRVHHALERKGWKIFTEDLKQFIKEI